MKLLENLRLIFAIPIWAKFPMLAVYDTILEKEIDILKLFENDLIKDLKNNNLGRKDTPSVEQIIRAILYKELRGITYQELEIHQFDSEICKCFLKLGKKAYSDSMYQHYIKKIKPETIKKMFYEINKIAIEMGYEDVKDIRTDATAIESNVHYPTNNSLIFDCVKTDTQLLKKLTDSKSNEYNKLINRFKEVKVVYYNLNNINIDEKDKKERKEKRMALMKSLFEENLHFLNEISTEIKEVIAKNINNLAKNEQARLIELDKQIDKIYKNAYRFQIEGKKVDNADKLFSIYESHTDIIVKGLRDYVFGHKVNLSSGKSNMILEFDVLRGNPNDRTLFEKPLTNIQYIYQKQIEGIAHDGGYASGENMNIASKILHIKNIVFTKVVGSMQNIVESPVKEKWLKNFRAGAEAVISNLKRGFGLQRVLWEGLERFKAKVAWSVLCYNLRVFSKAFI